MIPDSFTVTLEYTNESGETLRIREEVPGVRVRESQTDPLHFTFLRLRRKLAEARQQGGVDDSHRV